MKKLYIKQKLFSWKERFTVKNEAEEDCYLVEGDVALLGRQLCAGHFRAGG